MEYGAVFALGFELWNPWNFFPGKCVCCFVFGFLFFFFFPVKLIFPFKSYIKKQDVDDS